MTSMQSKGVLIFSLLFGALAGLGCSATSHSDDSPSASAQSIRSEQPNGVAQVVTRIYQDAELARLSYAFPDTNCSATMIGPNIMMTASHCTDSDRDITFHTYRHLDFTLHSNETFHCRILLTTYTHSDLSLYFCDPNSRGENPGDKYGYLDFDPSAPTVGERVISFWYNDIQSLGLSWDEIYSEGLVQSTNNVIWAPPPGTPPADLAPISSPIGIYADLWDNWGASGSTMLNALNHRILVGPTSTGWDDARGRWGLSAKTYFERGSADGSIDAQGQSHPGVFNATLRALGLDPAPYAGAVDKNHNYLFDVQEDLERLRGENRRRWYYLGFESARRNALWDFNSGFVTMDTDQGVANVNVAGATAFPVLTHHRLPIDATVAYRLTFRLSTFASQSSSAVTVEIGTGATRQTFRIATTPGSGWETHTLGFIAQSANPHLAFLVDGAYRGAVAAVSLLRNDAVMDFSTADQRYNWRNGNSGARGWVLPDGLGSLDNRPSWAGAVNPTPNQTAGTDWPLPNSHLALVPNVRYVVCFDAILKDTPPVSVDNRVMRVLSGGYEAVRETFTPSRDNWWTFCTNEFATHGEDSDLQFGFEGPRSTSYYVTNVQVIRRPCGDEFNGCQGDGICVSGHCVCPNQDPCQGARCGFADDGCGHQVSCGHCGPGAVCRGGQCSPPPPCCPLGCPRGRVCDPDGCACVIEF